MTQLTRSGTTITSRDIDILLMIYRYGGCAISHVFGRFWPSSSRLRPGNSCYRRVHQLMDAECLSVKRLPSLSGLGAGRAFLTLGPKGRRVLAEFLDLPKSELQRLRHIETPFIGAHHLAICDFRLSLELACADSDRIELVEWITERELRIPPVLRIKDPRPSPGQTAAQIPLIGDGEFRLHFHDGTEASLRLEMDMGTIPAKRMRARLRAYLAHARADERPVLWVVPDNHRLRSLAGWCEEEAAFLAADPTIFWVGLAGDIDHSTILGPIWQVVGGPKIALLPPIEARNGSSGDGGFRWK